MTASVTIVRPLHRALDGCKYVDHSFVDARRLGAYHEGSVHPRPATVLRLATCHRSEIYYGPEDSHIDHPWADEARRIGAREASIRLTEVAAGVRSVIIGERFVLKQVAAAVASLDRDSPLCAVGEEALHVARRTRDRFVLWAECDYPDLAHELVARRGTAPTLVIVGAGMLARAIALHPFSARYRRVIMVTRSAKRARRRLPAGARIECRSIHAAADLLGHGTGEWSAIVATGGAGAEYRQAITELLARPGGRDILDLGSSPLVSGQVGAVHPVTMYDEAFHEVLSGANRSMIDKVNDVRTTIAEYYRAQEETSS